MPAHAEPGPPAVAQEWPLPTSIGHQRAPPPTGTSGGAQWAESWVSEGSGTWEVLDSQKNPSSPLGHCRSICHCLRALEKSRAHRTPCTFINCNYFPYSNLKKEENPNNPSSPPEPGQLQLSGGVHVRAGARRHLHSTWLNRHQPEHCDRRAGRGSGIKTQDLTVRVLAEGKECILKVFNKQKN